MRIPPRAKKCQTHLDDIQYYLDYFMGGSGDEFNELCQKIRYLRDYINEVSQEKKLTEIKLAAKMKKENNDE